MRSLVSNVPIHCRKHYQAQWSCGCLGIPKPIRTVKVQCPKHDKRLVKVMRGYLHPRDPTTLDPGTIEEIKPRALITAQRNTGVTVSRAVLDKVVQLARLRKCSRKALVEHAIEQYWSQNWRIRDENSN